MAHEINLENYKLRTDVILDIVSTEIAEKINRKSETFGKVTLEEIEINEDVSKLLGKKPGNYKSVSFEDVTDKDNYLEVQKVFIEAFSRMLKDCDIKQNESCLIVGLGNKKSTPDALGPDTLNHVLVTRYLYDLGEVEEGFRNTAIIEPSVTGVTGIETFHIVNGITKEIKPDFLIVIDALASSSIDRVNKTIQISNAGIEPGSGVFNNRVELSEKTLNIPVIVIGIPTVVDAATIVSDTFQYMSKQFRYKIDHQDSAKLKLVSVLNQNYLDHDKELTKEQKEDLLGMIGTLSEEDFKSLIHEVLTPINYNLMVTPKEVDFVIEKFASLLGNGINKVLHQNYNLTK